MSDPSYQLIFEVERSENKRQLKLKVHGAEILCQKRNKKSDLIVSQRLRDEEGYAPIRGNLFVSVSEGTLADLSSFFRWLGAMAALKNQGAFLNIVIEAPEYIELSSFDERWSVMKDSGFKLALNNHKSSLLRKYPWDYCSFDMSSTDQLGLEAIKYCKKHSITPIAKSVDCAGSKDLAIQSGVMIHQGLFYCPPMTKNTKGESSKCSKVS